MSTPAAPCVCPLAAHTSGMCTPHHRRAPAATGQGRVGNEGWRGSKQSDCTHPLLQTVAFLGPTLDKRACRVTSMCASARPGQAAQEALTRRRNKSTTRQTNQWVKAHLPDGLNACQRQPLLLQEALASGGGPPRRRRLASRALRAHPLALRMGESGESSRTQTAVQIGSVGSIAQLASRGRQADAAATSAPPSQLGRYPLDPPTMPAGLHALPSGRLQQAMQHPSAVAHHNHPTSGYPKCGSTQQARWQPQTAILCNPQFFTLCPLLTSGTSSSGGLQQARWHPAKQRSHSNMTWRLVSVLPHTMHGNSSPSSSLREGGHCTAV